jgi:type IV secretory pathway VirB2 component (pilin)
MTKKLSVILSTITTFVLILQANAYAASSGMPWEGPLDRLANSLQGPVARVAGIASIVITGVGMAFSDGGSFVRKCVWVVAGLTIAFNAARWGLPFLGFSGGLSLG